MGRSNQFFRCHFCENTRFNGVTCKDRDGHEFLCLVWSHFYLDGEKVVEKARALGISVTDVLAMIEAADKLGGEFKRS